MRAVASAASLHGQRVSQVSHTAWLGSAQAWYINAYQLQSMLTSQKSILALVTVDANIVTQAAQGARTRSILGIARLKERKSDSLDGCMHVSHAASYSGSAIPVGDGGKATLEEGKKLCVVQTWPHACESCSKLIRSSMGSRPA
eukprot:541484-Pelagomonas_calceolata.AAC.2